MRRSIGRGCVNVWSDFFPEISDVANFSQRCVRNTTVVQQRTSRLACGRCEVFIFRFLIFLLTIRTVLFYFIVSCCVTVMAVLVTNLVLLLLINLIWFKHILKLLIGIRKWSDYLSFISDKIERYTDRLRNGNSWRQWQGFSVDQRKICFFLYYSSASR